MPAASLPDGLPERVRWSCAAVAHTSQLVTIKADRIAEYASTFDVTAAKRGAAADVTGNPNAPERAIALALATVAINFTSGWHDIITKRPGLSGAVSMVNRLVDYEHVTGTLTAQRLQSITTTDCSQIFEQPLDDGSVGQLLALLAAALNDLGDLAQQVGSFVGLIESADQSAVALAELLGQRDPWHDVVEIEGSQVAFYKRAQMAAATISRTFGGIGLGEFDDLDELTIFADNLVPHVLRLDGVLVYDPELEHTIDTGDLLEPGSRAEVEIRACGVHAAELLAQQLTSNGHQITSADIDHALWTRGGGPRYKAVPRHRCRNPFY